MNTEIITDNIQKASYIIRSGGLVAVPTETVYGLAGNGLDAKVVKHIYDIKGRPEIKALSLMVPNSNSIRSYCVDVPDIAFFLADRFWPGPLTIILNSKMIIPNITRAGGTTIGLRCPNHPLTLSLLKDCGLPLAAPSANPSGKKSPKNKNDVLSYFNGKIDAVIDGGQCNIGTESTIIDLSSTPYRIIRHGALDEKTLLSALKESVKLIGITGGSGGGKTTALRVLASQGALILDCDKIYHDLTISCEPMKNELVERFGNIYNGQILDRKKLGSMVFRDSSALNDLNQITHKYVAQALDDMLTDFARNGGKIAAIDAIGLLDIPQAKRTIINVAITAPLEARVKRLMARDSITEEYARSRISAQKSDAYFVANCDAVLYNDGTKEEFEQKCITFFMEVLRKNVSKY